MFPFSACYVKKDKFQYNVQLLQYPTIESKSISAFLVFTVYLTLEHTRACYNS